MKRSELKLVERALERDWSIPEAALSGLPAKLMEIVELGSERDAIAAGRVLVEMKANNDRKVLLEARRRALADRLAQLLQQLAGAGVTGEACRRIGESVDLGADETSRVDAGEASGGTEPDDPTAEGSGATAGDGGEPGGVA